MPVTHSEIDAALTQYRAGKMSGDAIKALRERAKTEGVIDTPRWQKVVEAVAPAVRVGAAMVTPFSATAATAVGSPDSEQRYEAKDILMSLVRGGKKLARLGLSAGNPLAFAREATSGGLQDNLEAVGTGGALFGAGALVNKTAKVIRGATKVADAVAVDLGKEAVRAAKPRFRIPVAKVAEASGMTIRDVPTPQGSLALKKEEMAVLSKGLGFELTEGEKMTFAQARANAQDAKAVDLAREILKKPRVLEPEEHTGMVMKAAMLMDDYNRSAAIQAELTAAGDMGAVAFERARADVMMENVNDLMQAEELAGTKGGQAQAIRKIRINRETYDLAGVVQRGTVVKGAKLTPAEVDKLALAVDEYKGQTDRIRQRIAKGGVDKAVEDLRPVTMKGVAIEALNTARTLKATADMGTLLRQNLLLSATRPVKASRAAWAGTRAFFSKYKAYEIDQALRDMPTQGLRERAGLFMPALEEYKPTLREEMYQSNWAQRIPVVGSIVRASERQFVTSTNFLRAHAFDEILKMTDATDTEMKAYANYINKASGRGDLGQFAGATHVLSTLLFAPRFAASRFQAPLMMVKPSTPLRVKAKVAKDLGALVGLGMSALYLASLNDDVDVELNPKSPDWGKIRVGNTRYDIWGGFQQAARATYRLGAVPVEHYVLGKKGAENPKDIISQYAYSKAAPVVTLAHDLSTGKGFGGQKQSPLETMIHLPIPMVGEDIWAAYRDVGGTYPLESGEEFFTPENLKATATAAAAGTASGVGVGVSTYKKRR